MKRHTHHSTTVQYRTVQYITLASIIFRPSRPIPTLDILTAGLRAGLCYCSPRQTGRLTRETTDNKTDGTRRTTRRHQAAACRLRLTAAATKNVNKTNC